MLKITGTKSARGTFSSASEAHRSVSKTIRSNDAHVAEFNRLHRWDGAEPFITDDGHTLSRVEVATEAEFSSGRGFRRFR